MCTVYGIYIVHVTLELVSSSRETAANHHVDVTSVGSSTSQSGDETQSSINGSTVTQHQTGK